MRKFIDSFKSCSRGYQIISLVLAGSLVIRILHTLAKAISVNPNSYNFTELLINFEGGFVRRGLFGQILYWICEMWNLSPFGIISVICIVAWIIFILFFFEKFHKLNYSWWLLVSPLFWGPPGSVIRKDYLCYLLIIGMLYLIRKKTPNIIHFVILCCIAIFGMFLHEAFIFYGFPIVALVLWSQRQTRVEGIVFSAIACLLFLLFSYYKGSIEIANTIVNSWNSLLGDKILSLDIPNSIEALGRNASDQFIMHMHYNVCEYNGSYFGWSGILIRPLFTLISYYLIVNFIFVFRKNDMSQTAVEMKTNLSLLYIFSLICLLPMFFFLSCDYGRLYQYAVVSSLAAFTILPQSALCRMFPKNIRYLIKEFNYKMNNLIVPSKGLLVSLLFIIAPTPSCFNPD